MSIIDRAKKQLENRFKGVGEETIRVMDAVNEEPTPKKQKAKPAPKPVIEKPVKPENELINLKNKIFSRPTGEKDEKKPVKEKTEEYPQETRVEIEDNYAFDYDDSVEKEYFENMDKRHKEKMKAYEKVPVPMVDEGKIQDILKILQIPPTFEIDSDIFLPDDLNDIAFDMQVPQGYETSEVDAFVSRTKISITKFVELLTIRNEDVAKLATVIDRLQVDISNMKLESEIANGINIMPTHDTEDLEQQNFELKSLVKRLEEQLESTNKTGNSDTLTFKEREIFEQLQDEVSLKDREIEKLKEELYNTKTQLSLLEESQDQESYFPQETSDYHEYNNNSDVLPDMNNGNVDELPDLDFSSDETPDLPDLSDDLFEEQKPRTSSINSAFEEDEESIEDFLMRNQSYYQGNEEESSINILDDNGSSYVSSGIGTYYDDEEDELDKLQKWGHN